MIKKSRTIAEIEMIMTRTIQRRDAFWRKVVYPAEQAVAKITPCIIRLTGSKNFELYIEHDGIHDKDEWGDERNYLSFEIFADRIHFGWVTPGEQEVIGRYVVGSEAEVCWKYWRVMRHYMVELGRSALIAAVFESKLFSSSSREESTGINIYHINGRQYVANRVNTNGYCTYRLIANNVDGFIKEYTL